MKTLERRYLKLREAIENCEKTQTVAPGDFLEPITQLTKIERKLSRLNELCCNGYPKEVTERRNGKIYRYSVVNEELQEKSEKQEAKLIEKAEQIAKENNFSIKFSGDPRGSSIELKLFPEHWREHTYLLHIS